MESKQPLSVDSVAYHLSADAPETSGPEVVPTESWFLHLPSPERVEISEDSMRLGNTGFFLTILTLSDTD